MKCWRKKPDLTEVEASRGDEGMVSIDKYFDKSVSTGEEKDRMVMEENKRDCLFV